MPSRSEAKKRFHQFYAIKFLSGKETLTDLPQIAQAAQYEPTFGPIDIEAVERNVSENPDEIMKGRVVLGKNRIM